jgi:glucan phosphorylase
MRVDGPEASAAARDGRAGELSDIVRISRALYDHHPVFDKAIDEAHSTPRERFEAFALTVREAPTQRRVKTQSTYARENPKRVYCLSMEFLKAVSSIASSGKFSGDRTNGEYAKDNWGVTACPVTT